MEVQQPPSGFSVDSVCDVSQPNFIPIKASSLGEKKLGPLLIWEPVWVR